MATLDLDGVQLAYGVEGGGPSAVAFVHGWCSSSAHWQAQAAAFAPSHRVVRWDRRGMGRSRCEQAADSPARHAQDLVTILDAEAIDRVVVVGHAGGGPTALTFAVRYPDRTAGLALVDTRLHTPVTGKPDRWHDSLERSCWRLEAEGAPYFEQLYRSFFGPRAATAVVDDAVANALSTPVAVATAELRHMGGNTGALARQVACPVLWVSTQPDDTATVRELFADLTVGHVVGSGHFVQVEVPDQLNPMLAAFLADKVAVG
jgi:pimeloyl-ACP methyl ester carboxylesterase